SGAAMSNRAPRKPNNDFPQEYHRPRFVREPFDEIVFKRESEIVKGLFPTQGVGFVAGPSKALKTFFVIDVAMRIAQGVGVLGRRTRACAVAYVAAEAPDSVRKRVQAWR